MNGLFYEEKKKKSDFIVSLVCIRSRYGNGKSCTEPCNEDSWTFI